jgi:tetratricopeptide (TPR) repeat protein
MIGWQSNLQSAERLGWPSDALQLERELAQAQCGALRLAEPKLVAYLERGHPEERLIFEALTRGYLEAYRLRDVVRFASCWKSRDPQNWQPFFYCGRAFEQHNAHEQSVKEYRAALSLNPDCAQVSLSLATLLATVGRFQEALDLYQARLKDEPTDTGAVLGIAYCQRALGGGEAALAALDRLFERDYGHAGGIFLRGQIELDLGRPGRALPWLRRAEELTPKEPQVIFTLSRCLRLLGKDEEARRYHEEWSRLSGEWSRLDELKINIASKPDSVSLRYDAGMILQGLGNYKEAVRWYQTILQLDPGHKPTHKALAICFDKLGDSARSKYHRNAVANETGAVGLRP